MEHPNELEQVLVGRLSQWTVKDSPLLFYLFKCFERLSSMPTSPLAQECRYFVLSYAGLVLMMPEMFQEGSEKLAGLGAGHGFGRGVQTLGDLAM